MQIDRRTLIGAGVSALGWIATGRARRASAPEDLAAAIRAAKADEVAPLIARRLADGLPERELMSVCLRLAAETRDLHQIAQIHAVAGIAERARPADRHLPWMWLARRIRIGLNEVDGRTSPDAGPRTVTASPNALLDAIESHDESLAVAQTRALLREKGARSVLDLLWRPASLQLRATLGHSAIGLSTARRAADAAGWEAGEELLAYLVADIARIRPEEPAPALDERARGQAAELPDGWDRRPADVARVTRHHAVLADASASDGCDHVREQLLAGRLGADDAWQALVLTACDLLHRHAVGGVVIGGQLVHGVTTTNAMRHAFELAPSPGARLAMLLQAIDFVLGGLIEPAREEGHLREARLVDLEPRAAESPSTALDELFSTLPDKVDARSETDRSGRTASDTGAALSLHVIAGEGGEQAFVDRAIALLLRKATQDPHDFKFPAALLEEAAEMAAPLRARLLASSVHALHGTASRDNGLA